MFPRRSPVNRSVPPNSQMLLWVCAEDVHHCLVLDIPGTLTDFQGARNLCDIELVLPPLNTLSRIEENQICAAWRCFGGKCNSPSHSSSTMIDIRRWDSRPQPLFSATEWAPPSKRHSLASLALLDLNDQLQVDELQDLQGPSCALQRWRHAARDRTASYVDDRILDSLTPFNLQTQRHGHVVPRAGMTVAPGKDAQDTAHGEMLAQVERAKVLGHIAEGPKPGPDASG